MEKRDRLLTTKWRLNILKIELDKAMTFRFGNDETLENKTMAIFSVGIAGVNGVLRVTWSLEVHRSCCHIDLGRGHLFFEKLEVRAVGTKQTVAAFAPPTDKFWSTGTQDPS